jgi:hypothetical protein
MFELDMVGETPTIEPYMKRYTNYGTKHEQHGIAEWVLWKKDMPKYILKDQKSIMIPNWLNLRQKDTISISSTPDGYSSDFSTILEVKCTLTKKECKPNFDSRWLPQIFGQQMIANMYFQQENIPHRVEKTHLINWGENRTKIYEIKLNQKFIFYLIGLLEEYSQALLKGKANGLEKEIKKLEWDREKAIKLIYEGIKSD